jgi:hypothetical protein
MYYENIKHLPSRTAAKRERREENAQEIVSDRLSAFYISKSN